MLLRALLLVVLALTTAAAQPVRSRMLVAAEWLAGHMKDPEIVTLHVARDRSAYDASHIPGARFLPWSELAVTRNGIPNELPPVAQLVELFERLGVGDESRVILYGDSRGLAAARAFFTLDYLGHGDSAALLDGGLEKWRAGGRPVTQEAPPERRGRLTPRLRPEVVVTLEVMRNPPSNLLLVDARSPADYSGVRIPGAANLYWADSLAGKENPVLRPASELRAMFEAAGAAPGRKIVTYCVTGVQASLAYFIARYLGYEAAMYDGSLAEWNTAGPGRR